MDREDAEHPEAKPEQGRVWTSRIAGPIRYTRFESLDAGGRPYVFFRVDEPSGSGDVADQVFAVFRDMKHLTRTDGGSYPTGLCFTRDRIHGRVWKVPATPNGRVTADVLDAKLATLARQLERDQGTSSSR